MLSDTEQLEYHPEAVALDGPNSVWKGRCLEGTLNIGA